MWLAGGVPAPGGRLRNPALAATWRRLLAEAEAATTDREGQVEAALAAFYEGFVAEAIAGWLEAGARGRPRPGRRRGHRVEVADAWSLGRTCAAGRDPATGFLRAAANARGRHG